jgi:type I restriction enzyme R subunit
MKDAAARIKINKLPEAAGWRFFPAGKLPANSQHPARTRGHDQGRRTRCLRQRIRENGKRLYRFPDFLLLDSRGFSFNRP